jgi:ribosomal protein S18 acetylase RimI-like enzyme
MEIRKSFKPGDLGSVIKLHGVLYGQEYGLDHTFEGHVASGIGEFAKQFDSNKDLFMVAEEHGDVVGSVAINGLPDHTAQLRWFLLHPSVRGAGVGKSLLTEALDFCRERRFKSVCLWTISELKAAAHLYRQAGFTITGEKTYEFWGGIRTEQRYDLVL